jgi:hypothetical protein
MQEKIREWRENFSRRGIFTRAQRRTNVDGSAEAMPRDALPSHQLVAKCRDHGTRPATRGTAAAERSRSRVTPKSGLSPPAEHSRE